MSTQTPIRESSFKTYRISGGKIRIGMGEGDEILDAISGFITGFDYTKGTNDDGEEYAAIRAELELESGEVVKVRCKVGLDKASSNVSAFGFGASLLQLEAGDDIAIFPSLGKPDPKYGKQPTFVSVGRVNPATGKYKDIRIDRDSFPGEKSKDKIHAVVQQLQDHALYKDLSAPKDDEEEDDNANALDIMNQPAIKFLMNSTKWANPLNKQDAYCAVLTKAAKREIKSYLDLTETEWASFETFVKKDKPPAGCEATEADEYDPFADE